MTDRPYSVNIDYLPEVKTSPDTVYFSHYHTASEFFCMMVRDESVARVSILDDQHAVLASWVNADELWETGETHPVTGHPIPCSCVACG